MGGEWEASSGALVLPGERTPERLGLPCSVSPPWAEPSPAQLIHAPLAQTPSTMAGSPPCLLAPWGGQQTPPLLGSCAPDPTACLGWGGTLHSFPSASPGTGPECAPPHQASSVGLPTPWGPAQEYPCPAAEVFVSKMKTKLWRDDTRTAGSPPWPGGASGFPAPRLAAGAPAFSPSFGVALSPSSLNPGVSQVAALALPPQPNWGLPPAASHYTPPCAG